MSDLAEKVKRLREVLASATPGGVTGDWYIVESAYLPRDTNTYVIAGSPDPHVGEMVCDFPDASMAGVEDTYEDDEWTARNWALAEYIAAVDPATLSAVLDALERLEGELVAYGAVMERQHARIAGLEAELAAAQKRIAQVDRMGWYCPEDPQEHCPVAQRALAQLAAVTTERRTPGTLEVCERWRSNNCSDYPQSDFDVSLCHVVNCPRKQHPTPSQGTTP